MTWVILGILLALFVASFPVRRVLAQRREQRLIELEAFRVNRKMTDEDVTVFGEQLAELHVDTLTAELDAAAEHDYRSALVLYETAKEKFARASDVDDLASVTSSLEEGRYARACVLARAEGTDLPRRREECFFNPQHGPAMSDLMWAPPAGSERRIAVCASDARRLAGGEVPDIRLVRVGDRFVPWFAAPQERGLLHASIGTVAVGGVPKYVMYEADLNRMRDQLGGAGGGGGLFG